MLMNWKTGLITLVLPALALTAPASAQEGRGDVVYVPTRSTVEAFPLAGCGAALCTSVASLAVDGRTSGQLLVDGGRVVVGVTGTTDDDGNHVVAFGLPA